MELPEYSIAEVHQQFERQAWTAVTLCEAFLQRLAEIDRAGPTLRSVLE